MNTIRVSNGLDPYQKRHTVGPDLGPNFLQRLSSEDKERITYDITLSEISLWIINSQLQGKIELKGFTFLAMRYMTLLFFSDIMTTFELFACWVIFMTFQNQHFQNFLSWTLIIRVSKGLDQDEDWHSVVPDLGPNCLHRLSADNRSQY